MGDQSTPSLTDRLDAVENRLARLEALLEQRHAAPPGVNPAAQARLEQLVIPRIEPQAVVEAKPASIEEVFDVLPIDDDPPRGASAAAEESVVALSRAPAVPHRPPPVTSAISVKTHEDLEQTIGLQWAGWIGAIVLVIGVGLGIHFAYEQGWFGHLPVAMRLLLMSATGIALLCAGEIVYRRVNIISAAGLFGAGVAVLFLVSYAGNTYYAAYSYQTAFVFAVLTTLTGSLVAVRARLVSVALLSQIGAQVGPAVLSTGQPPGLALLLYVAMLQLVAVSLTQWGQTPKWWLLRWVSLAATAWWVVVALDQGQWGQGLGNEVLLFTILYAAVYQGDLLRSALIHGDDEYLQSVSKAKGWGTVYSLLVTAGLTAVVLHVFYQHDSAFLRGLCTLLFAGLCMAAALFLRARNNPFAASLREGFYVQAAALVILFVPVAFSDIWICLAWAVLSIAFAVLGARMDRGKARGAGMIAWGLAVFRLLIDFLDASAGSSVRATWLVILDTPIEAAAILAWLLAVVGHVVAWLAQVDPEGSEPQSRQHWHRRALITSILASEVWFSASVVGLPRLGATFMLVAGAWLLVAGDFTPQRLLFSSQALALLVIATAKWFLVDTLDARFLPGWDPQRYLPVLNPTMGAGVLLAGSFLGVLKLCRRTLQAMTTETARLTDASWHFLGSIVFVAVVTFGLGFEVDRFVERAASLGYSWDWPAAQVKHFGLTVLWLAAAWMLLEIARRLGLSPSWLRGLVLLIASKFLLIDMLLMRAVSLQGPAPAIVLWNLQSATAILVLTAVWALRFRIPEARDTGPRPASYPFVAGLLPVLILLWAGTLEIDRAFSGPLAGAFGDAGLAKQVAVSMFWSLFALATVAAGFRWHQAEARYFGLALFGIALLKVVLFDMNHVQYGYRIIAMLGLGMLLLTTSVIYGKASRDLHCQERETL